MSRRNGSVVATEVGPLPLAVAPNPPLALAATGVDIRAASPGTGDGDKALLLPAALPVPPLAPPTKTNAHAHAHADEHSHHKKLTAYKIIGFSISLVAALAMGFITMTAFTTIPLFAGIGLSAGLAVFFAGSMVEIDVYLPGVVGAIKSLFFKWKLRNRIYDGVKNTLTKSEIREVFGVNPDDKKALKEAKARQDAILIFMSKIGNMGKIADMRGIAARDDASLEASLLNDFEFTDEELSRLKQAKGTEFVGLFLQKIESKKINKDMLLVTDKFKGLSLAEMFLLLKFVEIQKRIQSKLNTRYRLTWAALIAAIGTGVAFGAITFTHVAAAILTWGGAAAAITSGTPVVIFVVAGIMAVFSAAAYALMMYHTLAKAVATDAHRKFFHRLKLSFTPPTAPATSYVWVKYIFRCFFRVLVILGIIALSALVTMATGDAWLNSSEFFFAMFSGSFDFIPLYASIVSYFLVWVLFIPITTIFAIENSDQSLQELWTELKEQWAGMGRFFEPLMARFQQDNVGQLINPFRFILAIFTLLDRIILLAHIFVSGGISASGESVQTPPGAPSGFMDKVTPPLVAMVLGSASEGAVDLHFVIGGACHKHNNDLNDFNKGVGDGHNHEGGVTAKLVKAMVFLAMWPSFVWHNAMNIFGGGTHQYEWSQKGFNAYANHEYKPVPRLYEPVFGAGAIDDALSIAGALGVSGAKIPKAAFSGVAYNGKPLNDVECDKLLAPEVAAY